MPRRRMIRQSDDREGPDPVALGKLDALQQLEVFREYGAYAEPAADDSFRAGRSAAVTWHVLLEEQRGFNDRRTWELSEIYASGTDSWSAIELAEELSSTYTPSNPLTESGRDRYRTADGWIVVVHGAVSSFRFRLTLAEHIPD